jgi:hypothetical protein
MSQQIDLSKPVYCGGVHEKYIIILTLKTDILVTRTTFDFREWGLDGTPLGDWPPLTNTPLESDVDSQFANREVKPSVVETGEEVKGETDEAWEKLKVTIPRVELESLRTRIADLEAMVRELVLSLHPLAAIDLTGCNGNVVYQRNNTFITKNNVIAAADAIDNAKQLVP